MSDVALGGVIRAGAVEPASSSVASLADSLLVLSEDLRPRLVDDFEVEAFSGATSLPFSAVLSAAGFLERELREFDFAFTFSASASTAGISLAAGFSDLDAVFEVGFEAEVLGAALFAADAAGFRVAEAFALEAGFELVSSEFETGAFESLLVTISGVLQAA